MDEDNPFGPDGEGGASHYAIDPYGAAITNIATALEAGFKHHGGMNDTEFLVLVSVARTLKEEDPAIDLSTPELRR